MKFFFLGRTQYNSGPDNINRGMIKHLTDDFYYLNSTSKIIPPVSEIKKIYKSDVVIVSGLCKQSIVIEVLAKVFGKKLVYIMHGFFEYEAEINRFTKVGTGIKHERFLLKESDLILIVSKKYMNWMKGKCPQYADKMDYLFNGIDKENLRQLQSSEKIPGTVAAAGGIRRQKKNDVLTQVAEELSGRIKLSVYGSIYNGLPPMGLHHTHYTDVLPHSIFLERLSKTEIFVVNSVLESFSVSVLEALFCGCSVLVSEVAGITDILKLDECDIIHNPDDKEEIKSKLLYLQKCPNNKRILANFNLDEYGFDKSVERLESLCTGLLRNNNRKCW